MVPTSVPDIFNCGLTLSGVIVIGLQKSDECRLQGHSLTDFRGGLRVTCEKDV